jgi:phosphoribosylformylglycinamidine synthase subunit PurSL
MIRRVEVGPRPGLPDVMGRKTAGSVKNFLGLDVSSVRCIKVFTLEGLDGTQFERLLEAGVLHDPVLQEASLEPLAPIYQEPFDWALEVGFRPGVTDNEGRTAMEAVALVLGLDAHGLGNLAVYTATQYLISGDLERAQVEHIATGLLANTLIQRHAVKSAEEWRQAPGFPPTPARVSGQALDTVDTIPLQDMDDDALMAFSKDNVLALSLEEMQRIRDYYAPPEVRKARQDAGFPQEPTDAEIECLAQTWSEHCKHKIFNARIDYRCADTHRTETVDSLFNTCIQKPTERIRKHKGDKDFCLSVFKDNAGVIRFTEEHNICVKVETHNSPSALDPYGGALTGIVGVNRDPMGTGLGAQMVCNTDVFCFASPFWQGELPPRLLHPRRVLEGVREGVEHGGNKSGIPTVNGSLVFDERYLGKPLVFCGTVGMMPRLVAGRPSHEKLALPGDAVVMVGGRIGKDGIHGATFSSEELHEGSPATAVQIGDPITQRKMYDFLMRVRDMGLYNAITDNGAGGLSSSVGEMAEDSGGAELDLSLAPLKYDGLRPWEILLSEAQERMTLAVPQDNLDEFLSLAEEMQVEATVLGRFTDSGHLHVRHGEKPVAWLDMDFLHNGVPQMRLEAVWETPPPPKGRAPAKPSELESLDQGELLSRMLGRLNICSKEYIIRQYDHEVKAGSVVKPLVGVLRDGPADAAVLRPLLGRDEALVVSHGICPRYSDLDTYWMMANAVDEAVRNAVAVGADLEHMAGVDNFCWCDPVQSEKTPDGRYKLAQLVRANRALEHFCQAYGVPCVSGKDSMKNDYTGGGRKISIPPTVLFTVVGVMRDASRAVTSDFKNPGDVIFLLGMTRDELGGSELLEELGLWSTAVPQVDALAAKQRYRTLKNAIDQGMVNACHDLSDGGLAVALAEMAIGGRLGAVVDLAAMPAPRPVPAVTSLLYSESASRLLVTTPPDVARRFEELFAGQALGRLGLVSDNSRLTIHLGERSICSAPVATLAQAWKEPLDW